MNLLEEFNAASAALAQEREKTSQASKTIKDLSRAVLHLRKDLETSRHRSSRRKAAEDASSCCAVS